MKHLQDHACTFLAGQSEFGPVTSYFGDVPYPFQGRLYYPEQILHNSMSSYFWQVARLMVKCFKLKRAFSLK